MAFNLLKSCMAFNFYKKLSGHATTRLRRLQKNHVKMIDNLIFLWVLADPQWVLRPRGWTFQKKSWVQQKPFETFNPQDMCVTHPALEAAGHATLTKKLNGMQLLKSCMACNLLKSWMAFNILKKVEWHSTFWKVEWHSTLTKKSWMACNLQIAPES